VLFGPAETVTGEARALRGGASDDDAFVSIRHRSGVESLIWASELAAAPGPRFRVSGTEGAFVAEGLDGQEEALRTGLRPDGSWGREPEERWGRLVTEGGTKPVPSEPGAWPEFYRRFEAALRGDGDLPVDPRDAVGVLEVLEQVDSV
jgi:predicted dehydrogenase